MTRGGVGWFACALGSAFASALVAQQSPGSERIELRVIGARGRAIVIDRGASDGLRTGDRAWFRPLDALPVEGVVGAVDARSAEVELLDPTVVLANGTRGDCEIPASRFDVAVPTPPILDPDPSAQSQPAPESAPHPPWENRDEEYASGDPLLSHVRPLRPSERARTLRGRWYLALDHAHSGDGPYDTAYDRLGASVDVSNLTGRGDRLSFDGELVFRSFETPDDDGDDESGTRLRIDRLAYGFGGTRYEQAGWTFGRFLQVGMPEFGVLDGAEWGWRRANLDRVGISLGTMPEPVGDYGLSSDGQLAAYYRWVSDASELVSAAVGYQKTSHAGELDRDLLVANVRYLPVEGWRAHATAWVDYYSGGDDLKPSGFELTQLLASASRSFSTGTACDFVYTHSKFPLTEHEEFEPVSPAQYLNDRADRFALTVRQPVGELVRVRATGGAWSDEDDDGFDAEVGVLFESRGAHRARIDLGAFATQGRFEESVGGRLSLGMAHERGRWSVDYELANHHFDAFSAANDDLPQQRLRIGGDWAWLSGWNLAADLSLVEWAGETSFEGSVYLQRGF